MKARQGDIKVPMIYSFKKIITKEEAEKISWKDNYKRL
jgi:hypothetical protein